MSMDGDLWCVKLANGDVHKVTLDQIDDAFNAGRIDGSVLVMAAGSTRWTTLNEAAGLDSATPPAPAPPTPTPTAVAYAPYPQYAPPPSSMRPMTMDIGAIDYYGAAPFRSGSRKRWAFAAAGVLAVGGISFAAAQSSGGTDAAPISAAAAVAPPPAMAIPPAAAAPATDPTADEQRLTPAQKQKLLEADKQLEQKMKARDDARASAPAPHTSPKYRSQGFTTGGSKYDPLNASF